MVETLTPGGIILASVPDDAVPVVKVETKTASRREALRASRFLKGPILLSWVREHIRDPADRLLLVIRAHADMRQSAEFKLGADVLQDAGIGDRKATYRALSALEANASLEVSRKAGRRPIVRLTSWQSGG